MALTEPMVRSWGNWKVGVVAINLGLDEVTWYQEFRSKRARSDMFLRCRY
jgi:hypothetical protein